MELNRDQIIKALECCVKEGCSKECPYFESGCTEQRNADVIALIEQLTDDVELWKGCSEHSDELLRQNLSALDENIDEKIDMFADKLKAKMTGEVFSSKGKEKYGRFYESDIDKIAAEVKVE